MTISIPASVRGEFGIYYKNNKNLRLGQAWHNYMRLENIQNEKDKGWGDKPWTVAENN
ncbi:hypothetical protein ACLBSL_33240 [Klebsiella pneumoniae]|uniref:hypothetical protein n=1 Tax=Klebsiella pneumoniae TaxID=573 RepID=UPI0039684D57